MDSENTVYPLSRYWYSGDFRFYYAYGNTPAQDFLQNITGEREPEILVLGCGDIRSCFYSLWKNFDVQGPARFDGVHFVLNDISAAVLARNILFLYLCLQMPEEENAARKWLSGIWAIWYCHELHREHYDMLQESLTKLCGHCNAWSSKDNPLYPLVKFTSFKTLNEVKSFWRMWLNEDIDIMYMYCSRICELFKIAYRTGSLEKYAEVFVEAHTEIPYSIEDKHDFQARKSDVLTYLASGSVYAETVLELSLPQTNTFVNSTLYERKGGQYSLHYLSLPYSCYHHAVDFSTKNFQSVTNECLDQLLCVKDSCFDERPFMSNSIQQFCLWLRSSHKLLCSESSCKLSFTFDCSHALNLCYEMESTHSFERFDLIYSSNLMDHLGPPNLVLSAVPLLKKHGLMFTSTLRKSSKSLKKTLCTSWKEFLHASFGFDSKLFPLILGVRCINHEGKQYASPVTIKPCPVTLKSSFPAFKEDILIWEKMESGTIPLVFSNQPLTSILAEALLSSFQVMAYPLLKVSQHYQMTNNLCIETAAKIIQTFMSNNHADYTPDFWKPLSNIMQSTMKPFLSNFQAQLLLHGIHMHLILSEETCPVCLKIPISESIGLFSAKYFIESGIVNPRFMAFVHQEKNADAKKLYGIATNGNVHIFDCISSSASSENYLQLYFYAPLSLARRAYKVTIIGHTMCMDTPVCHNLMSIPTQPLASLFTSFVSFKFFQACGAPESTIPLKSFGAITSHLSDGDTTSIQLKFFQEASPEKKLQSSLVSSNTLQLFYGKQVCQLKLPYPVEYNSMKIMLKRSKKELYLQCNRAVHMFTDEKPIFVHSPDKNFSLSPLTLSKDIIRSFCGQQFTKSEVALRKNNEPPPLAMVKESFRECFLNDCQFINFIHTNGELVIIAIVNHKLFDYENKVPVIDLAFCCFELIRPLPFVFATWKKMTKDFMQQSTRICDEEYQLLKVIFSYFASRTHGTCNSISDTSSGFSLLVDERIDSFFTRAVVCPLLSDPDDLLSAFTIYENCRNDSEKKNLGTEYGTEPKLQFERSGNSAPSLFPLTRYWYGGEFRFYYAYGNTPAEDFLQNCPGVREPSILLLGCGDIRSCFYTLWRNFNSSIVPHRFSGVHFILNDWSPSVLARNIVFLYLCLILPKDKEKNTWLCAMWAIWYCHELYAEHQKVLDDCLKVLLKYSQSLEQWASTDNPMQRLVKFTSPQTLDRVTEVWRRWLERRFAVKSVQEMHTSRNASLLKHRVLNSDRLENMVFSFAYYRTFIHGDSASKAKICARMPEVTAYLKSGNCYAENVIKNVKFLNSSTTVNFTLYERPDGVYTLHYGSIPYGCYYHAIDFSPDVLASAGVDKSVCEAMLVESKCFKSLPFLANSVQQFCLWVQSASKVLNNSGIPLSFTFNDLHAVSFCQELQQSGSACENQFDLIHASNLMDHLGPSGVLLSSIPLLKSSGLLFTTTLISKRFATTVEDYLSTCIGFDCKLLPVVLGIRCVNHEGEGYCSPVIIEPNVPGPVCANESLQYERTLMWEKVKAQQLVIPVLPPLTSGNITEALFKSVQVHVLSVLTDYGSGQAIMNHNSLETVVSLLQWFYSSISTVAVIFNSVNHLFWEPLSSALQLKLKPYLNCLQTQAILHHLHIHFTPDTNDCLRCSNTAVEDNIGLFCANVPLPIYSATPHFICLVHKHPSSDARHLCDEAMSGKDVHIFDCIDGQVEEKVLKLRFFAPLKFVKQDYQVTLGQICMISEKNVISTVVPTASIASMQVSFMHYDFFQTKCVPLHSCSSSFGELTSHIYDGDLVHSEMHLSEPVLKALTDHKLNTRQVSPREIQLSCGLHFHYSLTFKYPINSKIKIKLSKAEKELIIVCKRMPHKFEEEKPVLVAIPDHQLSLPPQLVENAIMVSHSGIQMYQKEREIVHAYSDSDHKLMTPLLRVKKALMYFFQTGKFYFQLCTPHSLTVCGLVVVNQVLFDYQHKVPAVDLAFCFLDSSNSHSVLHAWVSSSRTLDGMDIVLNADGYRLLQKTLMYFANRTCGDCQTPGKHSRYQMLLEKNISRHFERAVVYLLYHDPDHQGLDMADNLFNKPKNSSSALENVSAVVDNKKCDYCGKYSHINKNCVRCKDVAYCSNECQSKHWPEHSKSCTTSLKAKTQLQKDSNEAHSVTSSQCGYCKKNSDELKKCLRCGAVQYCGKECQASHWPEHRTKCKGFYQLKMSQSSPETNVTSKSAQEMSCASPSSFLSRCSYCKKSSNKLKKCLHCEAVQYCGKECQANHWPEHKDECKVSSGLNSSSTAGATGSKSEQDVDHIMIGVSCAFCGMSSAKLKFCGRCRMVKYCGEACQRKHWKKHKTTCLMSV